MCVNTVFGYYDVEEKCIAVKENGKFALINNENENITEYVYDEIKIPYFTKEYFEVKKENKWGVIDKNGKEMIPCIYDEISYCTEDCIIIKEYSSYGMINIKKEVIIPSIYQSLVYCSDDCILEQHINWGVTDKNGKK